MFGGIWKSGETSAGDKEENETFLPASRSSDEALYRDSGNETSRWKRYQLILPWLITSAVLSIWLSTTIIHGLKTRSSSCAPASIREDDLYSTDLRDARRAITYERRRYTGDLVYDSVSQRVLRMHDGETQYVGEPSAKIDQAWEDLVQFEFPFLYGDEIPKGFDEGNRYSDKYFHFEPDFFHNLHCLNMLRMELSRSLYPGVAYGQVTEEDRNKTMELFGPGWKTNHLEHCVDRIRQALMCHGDLTPSYMYRYNGLQVPLFHTPERLCRKWEPIRAWVDERKRRDDSVAVNKANDMD